MLVLLFLVHMLSRNPSLAQGYTLHSRVPVDTCDNINSRSLFAIVWGCLITIFACTWVSVHPNVPPPDQSRLALSWRRLKMMLIAVIAPELMVGFAARQFLAAQKLTKEFENHGLPITLTHGFFFSMGGFVSQNGHPIVTIKQFDNSEYLSAIQKVKVADIMNRSKGDMLSKGVALFQGLWFVTQCIARISQCLPVTGLEVATLAFTVVNIFIWSLWWAKPLDVEQPIMVGPTQDLKEIEPTTLSLSLWDRFGGVFDGNYSPYLPITSTSVPAFWSMDYGKVGYDESNTAFYIECLVGTIFGAIHCAAWNADLPSTIEMWMWRCCSLMVAVIPAVQGALFALFKLPRAGGATENTLRRIGAAIGGLLFLVSIPVYPIARLFLIIIPLTSLRAIPPGAFIDVDWSGYIPHL
ncbi:hypothetical protein C8R44DRAFT_710095 [Mycena epipterygia]|nr:hypothetical protein C8R44DRAFT_710095 [Mycena epipterygia]